MNFGTNQDHVRNSLSNCGNRMIEVGDMRTNIQHTKKKGNLCTQSENFLEVCSFLDFNPVKYGPRWEKTCLRGFQYQPAHLQRLAKMLQV